LQTTEWKQLASTVHREAMSRATTRGDEIWIKDYRHLTCPVYYMTQDNERNANAEQSNDSVEANQMINTTKENTNDRSSREDN